jgi:hypothetical protein
VDPKRTTQRPVLQINKRLLPRRNIMAGETSIRASFRLATPALFFTLLVYSMGELAFGLQVFRFSIFGSLGTSDTCPLTSVARQ